MNWHPAAGAATPGEQLTLDVEVAVQDPQTVLTPPRTYWEHTGPGRWVPVTVAVRYAGAPRPAERGPAFPHLTTGPKAPQNVLVERADGTSDVRPVRLLRTRPPA